MEEVFTKDPAATLDYSWDWTAWLADVGNTINSANVTVPDGLTAVGSAVVDDGVVTQRVSGGQAETRYTLVCQITTFSGLIDERSMRILVRNR